MAAIVARQGMRESWIEAQLMVASYHEFVLVRKLAQPFVELCDLRQTSAGCEVAGVNENISVGNVEF